MNFEQPLPREEKEVEAIDPSFMASAEEFLGDTKEYIDSQKLEDILKTATIRAREMDQEQSPDPKNEVSYNKYNKSFIFEGKPVTAGQIVSSRHLGSVFSLPKSLETSLEGRKLQNTYKKVHIEDYMFDQINMELATNLAESTNNRDILLSRAYGAIAERSGEGKEQNEQLGVLAEKVIFGVAEMISIDRPDLGVTVHQSNAYQDVAEKIDFIIATKHKKRGAKVGIEENDDRDRHIGIQFTINTTKESHKKEQIAKAKERGIDVDDIVYVAVEGSVLKKALDKWNSGGRPVYGPWAYLPEDARKNTIKALFSNVITEEQEISLLKNV